MKSFNHSAKDYHVLGCFSYLTNIHLLMEIKKQIQYHFPLHFLYCPYTTKSSLTSCLFYHVYIFTEVQIIWKKQFSVYFFNLKLNQDQTNNFYVPITPKEMKTFIKSALTKRSLRLNGFSIEFYQNFKKS